MKIELPVSGSTNAKQLAGAVRTRYREHTDVNISLLAIGMSAINNAMKSVVELNKLLASTGSYITVLPTMEDRQVADRNCEGGTVERTVLILNLYKRPIS